MHVLHVVCCVREERQSFLSAAPLYKSLWGMKVVERKENAHEDGIWSVSWSNTSNVISTASVDGTVKTWDADGLKERHTCEGHHLGVISVAASQDGKFIASSSLDSQIKLWDVDSGEATKAFDAGPVECWTLAWSPDGKLLASGSQSGGLAHPRPLPCSFVPWACALLPAP